MNEKIPNGFLCSVVIPVYNEEESIKPLTARIGQALLSVPRCRYEIIFAMDPSTDRTEEIILSLRASHPEIKLLRFSRRFGQPAATLAGLRYSQGDICVVIDADLQDPPELIPRLIEKWQTTKADVVYAQRRTREGETYLAYTNESTYIPVNTKHRLENPEEIPLQIIEVQNGEYLEEDDIERFADDYGRP